MRARRNKQIKSDCFYFPFSNSSRRNVTVPRRERRGGGGGKMFGRFVRVTLTQLRISDGPRVSCTCRARNFYSLFSFNQNPSALESPWQSSCSSSSSTDGSFFYVLQHAHSNREQTKWERTQRPPSRNNWKKHEVDQKIRCTERAVETKCYGLSKKKLIALRVFASVTERRETMSRDKNDVKLFSKVTTGGL